MTNTNDRLFCFEIDGAKRKLIGCDLPAEAIPALRMQSNRLILEFTREELIYKILKRETDDFGYSNRAVIDRRGQLLTYDSKQLANAYIKS